MTLSPPVVQAAMTQSMTEWARALDASIQQNFRDGGRPNAWLPIKRAGRILQDTGRLKNSITVRGYASDGTWGVIARTNNIEYARIHQYGGWIRPRVAQALAIPLTQQAARYSPKTWPESMGKLFPVKKNGNYTLCISKGKRSPIVEAQYVLKHAIYIPARPYLAVQIEDVELLKKLIANYLLEQIQ